MKALVTGASGFVGSAVTRLLLEAGHHVRVLLRPQSDRRNVEGLAVETTIGDLTDISSLNKALAGCNALFHVAADYRLWARDPHDLYQNNVIGTHNIMTAASAAKLDRIVYTSSVATLGLNSDRSPSNEDTPSTLDEMIGPYKRSKFIAEDQVKQFVREKNLPVVVVNPSTPIGPRDIRPTPTGRMIVDAASGRMPAFVDTGLNLVHVDDVARGHLLAFEHGKIGQRYILGGHNLTLEDILNRIAAITGRNGPWLRLSRRFVFPIAYLSEAWAYLVSKREPRVTIDGLNMSKKYMFFSCDKARKELGYNPRPVEEALIDAIEWFNQHGYTR